MTHTVKQVFDAGDVIFHAGDPVRYFYCLLAGDVQVVRRDADGRERILNTLHAGEYFGENSLLEGNKTRSVTVRCVSPAQVLKLSKEDFDACFSGQTGKGGSGGASESELRSKLISFIRMVSCQEQRDLARGEPIFRQGDPADKFCILSSGRLAVWPREEESGPSQAETRPLAVLQPGEGFGENALLEHKPTRSRTITCDAVRCEVVEILGDDFLRLVEKSRVVRESFERLSVRRNDQNQQKASSARG